MPTSRAKAERLFGPSPASGCWIDLPSPEAAEIVALARPDFAVVDLEHGPASVETAGRVIAALAARGVAALARPPEISDAWIKRLLDSGADGLILPMVESAAEAREAAAAALYPPKGRRGRAAAVIRAAGWGRDAVAYARDWNDRAFLCAQIESPAALAAAPEIAAVEGIDLLFFGPSDYASFAGFHEGAADPRAFEAFQAVDRAAKAAGKLSGTVAFPAADGAALAAAGCDLVAAASDVAALGAGIATALASVKDKR